jgi:hypothetical protein
LGVIVGEANRVLLAQRCGSVDKGSGSWHFPVANALMKIVTLLTPRSILIHFENFEFRSPLHRFASRTTLLEAALDDILFKRTSLEPRTIKRSGEHIKREHNRAGCIYYCHDKVFSDSLGPGSNAMAVQQNTDHIQTTHIGSMPRPHDLLDLIASLPTSKSGWRAISLGLGRSCYCSKRRSRRSPSITRSISRKR